MYVHYEGGKNSLEPRMRKYEGRIILCRIDRKYSFVAEDDFTAKKYFEEQVEQAILENTVIIEVKEIKNV
jgi:hypothetical protein